MLPPYLSTTLLRSKTYSAIRHSSHIPIYFISLPCSTGRRWQSTTANKQATEPSSSEPTNDVTANNVNENAPDITDNPEISTKHDNSPSPSLSNKDGLVRTPGSHGGRKSHFASLMDSQKLKRTKKVKSIDAAPKVRGSVGSEADNAYKPKRKSSRTARDVATVKELVEKEGWKAEDWKDEWGKDELVAKAPPRTVEVPSLRPNLPNYTRRIEGLLESSHGNVLEEIEPPFGRSRIPSLAHGLDRVLFNPGVHWVQDPRSRVYNFPSSIQSIPDIKDFAFDRITPFIKSSRDQKLRGLTSSEGKRFAGSTSSLSGLLSHIYFLVSQDHRVDTSNLGRYFANQPNNFTPGQRIPASVVFNYREGVYLIDSDSTDNDDSQWNVLIWMGTMLEKFLTLPTKEFKHLLYSNGPDELEKRDEAYRYSKSKTFIMRSQLDCFDPRLPGSGVFDIKTRAALPIRLDNLNFRENSGYLIKSLYGPLESFEKEYYDLIRSAFLKYSFQARIGNMDGVFVAYHNTARLFGFQYVSLEEMDERLFGAKDRGWRIFDKCVGMLEIIAQEIADCFPEKTVTCLAETLENSNILRIWVQPVEDPLQDPEDELPEISTERKSPIIQLDIVADSYVDEQHVGGQTAVNASDKPWTVHWSISRSSLSEQAIRRNFQGAKSRKFRPYLFPAGVDSDNVDEFLRNIGFAEGSEIPNVGAFTKAGKDVESLRALSQAGFEETKRREEEERHLKKVIWQQPAYSEEELLTLDIAGTRNDLPEPSIDGRNS